MAKKPGRELEEKYMEDISQEMIAEKLGVSASAVSKLFKRKTGEGFVEYLTRKRIEASIPLMQDHTLSIEQISTRVGYLNTPTYIRNFKKIKGVSPGKYRSQIEEEIHR